MAINTIQGIQENDEIPKSNFRKLSIGIFFLSLIVHLVIAIVYIKMPIALDDMYQYDMLGRSLARGEGFRWYSKADVEILKPYLEQFMPLDKMVFPDEGIDTAFRAPGYPLFLSVFYKIDKSASRFYTVRIIQAILMSTLTLIVSAIGEHIRTPRKLILIASGFVGFYPMFLFYPIGLASENLFIPLLCLSFFLSLKTLSRPNWFVSAVLGLCLGSMILTRSVALLFGSVLCGFIAFRSKLHCKNIPVTGLLAALILTPWILHHSKIMKRPTLVENSFWYNIYITYHPQGNGNFVSEIAVKPLFITDDAERDAYCKQYAIQFIKADPLRALTLILKRTPAFFGPETRVFNYLYSNNFLGHIPLTWLTLIYLSLTLPWFFVCLFGFIGALSISGNQFRTMILLTLLLYCLPHLPITTEPRYHLAIVPLLAPLAFVGLVELHRRLSNKVNNINCYKSAVVVIIIYFVLVWAFQIWTDMPTYFQLLSPDGNLHGISY